MMPNNNCDRLHDMGWHRPMCSEYRAVNGHYVPADEKARKYPGYASHDWCRELNAYICHWCGAQHIIGVPLMEIAEKTCRVNPRPSVQQSEGKFKVGDRVKHKDNLRNSVDMLQMNPILGTIFKLSGTKAFVQWGDNPSTSLCLSEQISDLIKEDNPIPWFKIDKKILWVDQHMLYHGTVLEIHPMEDWIVVEWDDHEVKGPLNYSLSFANKNFRVVPSAMDDTKERKASGLSKETFSGEHISSPPSCPRCKTLSTRNFEDQPWCEPCGAQHRYLKPEASSQEVQVKKHTGLHFSQVKGRSPDGEYRSYGGPIYNYHARIESTHLGIGNPWEPRYSNEPCKKCGLTSCMHPRWKFARD